MERQFAQPYKTESQIKTAIKFFCNFTKSGEQEILKMSNDNIKVPKLVISPDDQKKQLNSITDNESNFQLSIENSKDWFEESFYSYANKELASNETFFKLSFRAIGMAYLNKPTNQKIFGKWIVQKSSTGLKLKKCENDQLWKDTHKDMKRDITPENLLFLDKNGMVEYPAMIKNYILKTQKNIKNNVWCKKMDIWKMIAHDIEHPDTAQKKNRASNKKRELDKFITDTLIAIQKRIDTDILEMREKVDNPEQYPLNFLFFGTKEKHSKKFQYEIKGKQGKKEKAEMPTLYSQLEEMKKSVGKYSANPDYKLPSEE